MKLEIEPPIDERSKAAWDNIVETLDAAHDYEGLFEVLIGMRNDDEFPDLLKRAMLTMHQRGRDSGIAEVMKVIMALEADTDLAQYAKRRQNS